MCIKHVSLQRGFCQLPRKGISIKLMHVFACDRKPICKRLIMAQHKDLRHFFDDVEVFDKGWGFCHVCSREHAINTTTCPIDWLIAGPVCKDISKLKANRSKFAGCYQEAAPNQGTSGSTYQSGFRGVAWRNPSLPDSLFGPEYTVKMKAFKYIYIYIYSGI